MMMSNNQNNHIHANHSNHNNSFNNGNGVQHQQHDDHAPSHRHHQQQRQHVSSPNSFDSTTDVSQSRSKYNEQRVRTKSQQKERHRAASNHSEQVDQEQHLQKQTHQQQTQQEEQQSPAIVTPELLVDALSGTEDGLLNIAERLMEYYDSGYDAMGEAIIDAFADVQKLFQHVVEAAHMEGAAYEAGRNNEEMDRLRKMVENTNAGGGVGGGRSMEDGNGGPSSPSASSGGPIRHDEFIDEDVRDVLLEAVRKGQALKEANKMSECFQVYEEACNNASSLLPVDSDHRGRLQLSIARADSMSPERACAILKYVMDDVLRSGLNANSKVALPDPSTRGDCVLARPTPSGGDLISSSSDKGQPNAVNSSGSDAVLQSSEEALASMVEEMKDMLGAPVYNNSPLMNVSTRFWRSLSDSQKNQSEEGGAFRAKSSILKSRLFAGKRGMGR